MSSIYDHSFGVTWRKALVSIPRLFPQSLLFLVSSEGPKPFRISLPSRGTHQIPVFAFVPPDVLEFPNRKLPVLIDFHGGGFVLGSCLEQVPFCAKSCRELRCLVLSVDYRLGPYAEFPAANEDAEDVLRAVVNEGAPGYSDLLAAVNRHVEMLARKAGVNEAVRVELDVARIGLSGFSSGGNLALGLAIGVPEGADPMGFGGEKREGSTGVRADGGLKPLGQDQAQDQGRSSTFSSPPTPTPSTPDATSLPPSLCSPLPSPLSVSIPSNPTTSTASNPIPILLFYPSLDARLLPSQRPLSHQSTTSTPSSPSTSPSTGLTSNLAISDILMPTYLPAPLRPHIRASPGLAPISWIDSRAKMMLILPERDSLAGQSEVWVQKVQDHVRVGRREEGHEDERWDDQGTQAEGQRDEISIRQPQTEAMLIVRLYAGMVHGWTQFPDAWLGEDARRVKRECFEEAVRFMSGWWGHKVAGDREE